MNDVIIGSLPFVLVMLVMIGSQACTAEDEQGLGAAIIVNAYKAASLIPSALGLVLFLLCFAGTRERVTAPVGQQLTLRSSFAFSESPDMPMITSPSSYWYQIGTVNGPRFFPALTDSAGGRILDNVKRIVTTGEPEHHEIPQVRFRRGPRVRVRRCCRRLRRQWRRRRRGDTGGCAGRPKC